jgi:hypothetical protein
MTPSTMIRNALGKVRCSHAHLPPPTHNTHTHIHTHTNHTHKQEFGGTGTPLDVERYRESVAFWSDHAAVR